MTAGEQFRLNAGDVGLQGVEVFAHLVTGEVYEENLDDGALQSRI